MKTTNLFLIFYPVINTVGIGEITGPFEKNIEKGNFPPKMKGRGT